MYRLQQSLKNSVGVLTEVYGEGKEGGTLFNSITVLKENHQKGIENSKRKDNPKIRSMSVVRGKESK